VLRFVVRDDRQGATVAAQLRPDRKLTPEREAELRKLLGLEGTGFEDELAEALRCSTRTIQRYGLPYTVIGNKRLYDLRGAGEKLRQIARIGTPGPDDDAEGDFPPAVRHRRRVEREGANT
jgi:hypothetical protein